MTANQQPAPPPNPLYDHYSETVYQAANQLSPVAFSQSAEQYAAAYTGLLPATATAPILDIGCGLGHFLYYLAQQGYTNLTGVDIAADQLAGCRQQVPSAQLVQADAAPFLAQCTQPYAMIAAHDVLEHIPKPALLPLLQLIHAALATGGVFVARVPNMSNPFGIHARYGDFTHESGFTAKSLTQVLTCAGFTNLTISSSGVSGHSFRRRVRTQLVRLLHQLIRFAYYIQDYAVPRHLGKNLTIVCRK